MDKVVSMRELQYVKMYRSFYKNGGVNLKKDIIHDKNKEIMKIRTRAIN